MKRGPLLLLFLFLFSFSVSAVNLTQKFDYCGVLNYSFSECYSFWGFSESNVSSVVYVNLTQPCNSSNITVYYPLYIDRNFTQNVTVYLNNQSCDLVRLEMDYDQQYRMTALSKGCSEWCVSNYKPVVCPSYNCTVCESCNYSLYTLASECEDRIVQEISKREPVVKKASSAIPGVPDIFVFGLFILVAGVLAAVKLGWIGGRRGGSDPVVINVPDQPSARSFKEVANEKSDVVPPRL